MHSDLIITLVAAFVAAFAGGFIAGRIGLPPIVGYVIAGIVIGPATPGGSADTTIASDLAEVGVILLMFGVGLHFSIRDLLSVGRIAIPGAVGQSAIATLFGFGVGQLWGWSFSESLIFGLCLSVASTVVLLRALEDRNLLDSHSGHIAIGWLIVEDLFTVLILVLLPALAGDEEAGAGLAGVIGGDNKLLVVVLSLLQAGVFVVLMLVVGVRLIPRLLTEVVRTGSRELFTLSILAIALGVAFGSAELFGASLALGAFLAGIVLNESDLSQRAGLEALPLRDAFAVLFFVSVGMLFEPEVLVDEPLKLLQVVAIIVVAKSVIAFVIVCGLGYGVRTGLMVAAALAQIGEFSFILAHLSEDLSVLPAEANSLIVGAAIVSITLNPVMFAVAGSLESRLERWPRFRAWASRQEPERGEEIELRRHIVICGYGRIGSGLARVLKGRNIPFVVIESDPFVFQELREQGFPAVFGDGSNINVLQEADTADARTIAVTFEEQPAAALAVQNARELNEDIDVVARGSGAGTRGLLRRAGAAEVVDPGIETALEFVRHVLHRSGIGSNEILALQASWRAEAYDGRGR